ncbi:hypothetical protein BC830DRAFT_1169559 [Chytriomyces sp. MP71]|nr:hypothetical protein BC830DRAFT_1169559 [Chytriomyces sp. MP71]
MHPNYNPAQVWPLKFGQSNQHYEQLLVIAANEATVFGAVIGLGAATLCGGLVFAASKLPQRVLQRHGFSKQAFGTSFRGIGTYHIGLASAMGGLLTSQIGTHYIYYQSFDEITHLRRMEAWKRAEARRQGEL